MRKRNGVGRGEEESPPRSIYVQPSPKIQTNPTSVVLFFWRLILHNLDTSPYIHKLNDCKYPSHFYKVWNALYIARTQTNLLNQGVINEEKSWIQLAYFCFPLNSQLFTIHKEGPNKNCRTNTLRKTKEPYVLYSSYKFLTFVRETHTHTHEPHKISQSVLYTIPGLQCFESHIWDMYICQGIVFVTIMTHFICQVFY